jgi:hypothetical protein
MVGLMTRRMALFGQMRLKSLTPTFSNTEFVCQKTCVKTGDFSKRLIINELTTN